MKTPYFYIIKHIPSGKYYAGCKINSSADPSNLMTQKGYKTTSKIVKKIIKEDGLESFTILRLRLFNVASEALNYESRFLKKVNAAQNVMFLNLSNGGKNFCNKGGYKLRESTKKKMRKPKSTETIKKQNKEKTNRSKDVYLKMVETRKKNNPIWNNEKMRKKISESSSIRFKNEENRKLHSEIMKKYYENNPVSEETRKKLSGVNSGENNNMFGKKHSEATKAKMKLAWAKRKLKNK